MKRLALILLLASSLGALAQQSYWWSQMVKKPDAKQSQEFFFVPGQGVFFTYQTNRVIINASGGTGGTNYVAGTNIVFTLIGPTTYEVSLGFGGITTNICVRFCDGTDRTLTFTNGLLAAVSPPPLNSFLIQPAGLGYLLQPGGGKFILP